MELPNRHLAYVPEKKITHYLLDVNHPKGGGKARSFRGRGYDESNVSVFIQDLLGIAQTNPVAEASQHPYGIHYVIDGELQTPDGRSMRVHTVWIIETGQDTPRLLSSYPDDSAV